MRLPRAFPLFAVLVTLAAAPATRAQDRIAFANVELILALMPATEEANRTLGEYQQELAGKLRTKERYAQQKLEEAQEAVAGGAAETELESFREELSRLEDEIRTQAAESDRKMATRRDELMAPVVERLGKILRDIALEDSYDFILNAVDGSGTSIVLFGREDRDVTKRALEKLGIPIPGETAP